MNTIGILFESKEKRYPAAPDWSGKFSLSEPFLRACVDAWRAHRDSGKPGTAECKIEARKKEGQNGTFLSLSLIPPKGTDA
jgi:hypothetical protein